MQKPLPPGVPRSILYFKEKRLDKQKEVREANGQAGNLQNQVIGEVGV